MFIRDCAAAAFCQLCWPIGLFGVRHGLIGRSRLFDAALGYGGLWAFSDGWSDFRAGWRGRSA
jgi:hypothetical protein